MVSLCGLCPAISHFLCNASKELDKPMINYDNVLILGDFNSEMSENAMKEFCEIYDLQNLINEPTCYINARNPSCSDIILTKTGTKVSKILLLLRQVYLTTTKWFSQF